MRFIGNVVEPDERGGHDQIGRQFSHFVRAHHPAHHLPTEDIYDHITLVGGPFSGTAQRGDIYGRDQVRGRGHQLRPSVGRVYPLVTTLSYRMAFFQNTIHRAPVTHMGAFIQQRGPYRPGRQIHEPL